MRVADHVYAVYLLVPFAVVELYSLLKNTRLNWGVIGMMAMAFMSVTFAIYRTTCANV